MASNGSVENIAPYRQSLRRCREGENWFAWRLGMKARYRKEVATRMLIVESDMVIAALTLLFVGDFKYII